MREVRKRSVIPIYGAGAAWALYCLIFPLYRPSHILFSALFAAVVYFVLSKVFPGEVTYEEVPEEPVSTGNEAADELLNTGKVAVSEMKRLKESIGGTLEPKIDELIDITDKIFKDIVEDPDDIPQVKRFSDYYLPTTIKLLNAYDRMSMQSIEGENISGTLTRIEDILDTTIAAYKKQLDSLFANQALDIETDITVLESMLKREGLSGKEF